MEFLTDLWLPIIVATVVLHFASFVVWAILPIHKADVQKLPDEEALLPHLEKLNLKPGFYMWPQMRDGETHTSESFLARYNKGPWGSMTVLGGRAHMGKNISLMILYFLVVNVIVAYLTHEARVPGDSFARVFQVAGTISILAYIMADYPTALWFGKPKRWVITDSIDGIVYGLIGGAIFAWLWPAATGVTI